MRITITGSSGFVGKNLKPFLEFSGYEVSSYSLRDALIEEKINIDGDVIIHLAGKAHDLQNVARAEEYFNVNRDLTIRIFDDFLQSDIRDFFFFSSVKAAADQVE